MGRPKGSRNVPRVEAEAFSSALATLQDRLDVVSAELHATDEPMHPASAVKTHVTMKRNPAHHDAPHTANVHVDEVANWAPYGWELVD